MKGLQILATFPGEFLPISKSIFENVLLTFISIIVEDFNKTLLWKLALKALVQIGSFIDRFHESEKALSYNYIVVEKIVSLMFLDDFGLPFQLRLEAISDIGTTGLNVMLKIVEGLEDAIFANLSEVYVSVRYEGLHGRREENFPFRSHEMSCLRKITFVPSVDVSNLSKDVSKYKLNSLSNTIGLCQIHSHSVHFMGFYFLSALHQYLDSSSLQAPF